MDDLRYIYSVARVKVLETYLFKKEAFLNLLQAKTLEDALRSFAETVSYTTDILGIRDYIMLDTFINQERKRLEKLARELFVENSLFEAYVYLRKDLLKSYTLISQTKSKILQDFIRRFIDLYNIKTFLRMDYQKRHLEVLESNLIGSGYIPIQEFINLFGRERINFYSEVTKAGMAQIEKEGDFSVLERDIENYLINLIKPAKYMFFGPEPVFGYCLAKENELVLLQLILLSKINNISQDLVQKRLTQAYA